MYKRQPQTIATFTRHQIGTVERALHIFLKLGFVELLTDGAYYMPDIQLLVGRSSTDAVSYTHLFLPLLLFRGGVPRFSSFPTVVGEHPIALAMTLFV